MIESLRMVSRGVGHARRLLPALFASMALAPAAVADEPPRPDETGVAHRSGGAGGAPEADPFAALRRAMVETLRRHGSSDGGHAIGERVLDVMGRVPRHEFVPAAVRAQAYDDSPLPIGGGQTISQPYIVALMTELAGLEASDRVLEVGTGSGYQAAVLAGLVARVFTIEIVEPLGHEAAATLKRLGIANVETRIGDGHAGWPDQAPFDAILVTAAPESIPQPLVDQLAVGARLVVPVGGTWSNQQLTVLEKQTDGSLTKREVLPVRFVPFTRGR